MILCVTHYCCFLHCVQFCIKEQQQSLCLWISSCILIFSLPPSTSVCMCAYMCVCVCMCVYFMCVHVCVLCVCVCVWKTEKFVCHYFPLSATFGNYDTALTRHATSTCRKTNKQIKQTWISDVEIEWGQRHNFKTCEDLNISQKIENRQSWGAWGQNELEYIYPKKWIHAALNICEVHCMMCTNNSNTEQFSPCILWGYSATQIAQRMHVYNSPWCSQILLGNTCALGHQKGQLDCTNTWDMKTKSLIVLHLSLLTENEFVDNDVSQTQFINALA